MLEFPPFRLDTVNQCLWRRRDGAEAERILMPPTAFAVLRYLVEHAGRLVSEKELLEAVWPRTFVEPQAVKKQVFEIRKVLGDDAKTPRYIETLQRRGYQFIAPIHEGPAGAVSAKRAPGRVVGRERQLAELCDWLRTAASSQRQIVFVSGEAGIGKTALVDELQRQVAIDAPGIRIARSQCVEGYGGKEAYYPVLEALGQLCHGPGGASIVETLTSQAPTWLVQFPALVKREHRETLQQEILGATRERMLREIGVALDTIATQVPILLVFEDLQWVDHSTVDLVAALARRQAPAKLMLVATERPVDMTPLKELKQELLVHQLCHEIELGPLSEVQVAEYLAAESASAAVPEGLAELIYRHTEGNPLFMVAALDHLTRRGLISRESGSWQLSVPLAEIDLGVPESLGQMIEAQIHRLSAEERGALDAASVAGTAFTAIPCAAAIDVDAEEFDDRFESLVRRHRIVRTAGTQQFPDGSISSRYEFVHALYREVVYRQQAPLRRAKLHRRIGERLEALYEGQLSDVAPELAHHFEEGADWLRAVKYLQLAADTAAWRYARREAMALLQHALELSNRLPAPQRVESETRILEKQATMLAVSFDTMPRAIETYESMAERARRQGLTDVELRAVLGMSYPLHWYDSKRCVENAERALRLSAEQADPVLHARARAACLYWRVWAGGWNSRDAHDLGGALADLRLAAGNNGAEFALTLLGYALIQWSSSHYRDALKSAAEGLAIALESGERNPYFIAAYQRATLVLPWCHLYLGEWGEALRAVKSGVAMMEKNADPFRALALNLFGAWVRLHAMDFEAVRAYCQMALPLYGDPARIAYPRLCLILAGQAEAGLGRYERAQEYLLAAREAIDGKTAINTWYLRKHLESAFTELWLARGDVERAQPQAQRFLEVAMATEGRTWQALAWEANAQIATKEGDHRRGQDCIAKALSTMDGFEVPLAAWRVHAAAAEVYEKIGNKEREKHHLELSRATILKLADSLLPEEEALRKTFLAAPTVSKILAAD